MHVGPAEKAVPSVPDRRPTSERPLIVVGIGGTTRPESTTERALRACLAAAAQRGAQTRLFGGRFLAGLPLYDPAGGGVRSAEARQLIEGVRDAHGVIVATPGYHGSVSGMVKNALDYLEELRDDRYPYLQGRPVGCVITAGGWQSCGSTLAALRSIVHSLRGWPTSLGATLNTTDPLFGPDGTFTDERAAAQLAIVGIQVAEFAYSMRLTRRSSGDARLDLAVAGGAAGSTKADPQ